MNRRTAGKTGRYKSQGEAQIARCLGRHGIGYLYEHPLAVIDRGKVRVWYPDFQLPGYGILIEYCGRMDDPAYQESVAHKREVYSANGLTGLMLSPEDLSGDWPRRLLDRIEHILDQRSARLRAAREQASRRTLR